MRATVAILGFRPAIVTLQFIILKDDEENRGMINGLPQRVQCTQPLILQR